MLRAVQIVLDEGLARPIADRPAAGDRRSASRRSACACRRGATSTLVNPEIDPRYRDYWTTYHRLTERKGVSPEYAQDRDAPPPHADRRDDDAQGRGRRHAVRHLRHPRAAPATTSTRSSGGGPGVRHYAAMNALILPDRTIFICDTYVTPDPDAEHIAEMTVLAAEEIRRFGIVPKVALLSALQLRLGGPALGAQDAAGARDPRRARAGPGGRGRNARRCRALGRDPPAACFRTRACAARPTCW